MGSEAGNGGRRGSKRTASRARDGGNGSILSASTEYQEAASQVSRKSSYTAAHYRHSILAGANILFRFRPAPEETRTRIAAIVQRQVLSKRKKELSRIAQELHDSFVEVLSTAAREDDCIEPFYHALSSMGCSESLALPRKAGIVPLLNPYTHISCSLHF